MLCPVDEQASALLGFHIKTQHELPKLLQASVAVAWSRFCSCFEGSRCAEHDVFLGLGRAFDCIGFDLHERRAGIHLHIRNCEDLAHSSGKWGHHLHFHLHRFEHCQAIAGGNNITRLDSDRDDDGGRGRVHDAAIVAVDLVRDSVHFNSVT